MVRNISSSNIGFEILKNSKDFLKLIVDDISSCILLLNKDMILYAFNNPLKTIFSNKPDEHLLYKKCGDAIGCAHTIEEMSSCGNTTQCSACELRELVLLSYVHRKNVYKGRIIREFYKTDTLKVLKNLQFSTRTFHYNQEYYIIVIIDDITPLVKAG